MKKKFLIVATAAAMTMATSVPAFAAGWQQNGTGWWYGTNADNSQYYANGWQWIDGNGDGVAECYYFDGNGYLLTSSTTSDGYTVNADGAWVENGQVQAKQINAQQSDAQEAVEYNDYGVSVVALDMLHLSSKENAEKYKEVKVELLSAVAFVDYENGYSIMYENTPDAGQHKTIYRRDGDYKKIYKYYDESLKTKNAVKKHLTKQGLQEKDRFNIYDFNDSPDHYNVCTLRAGESYLVPGTISNYVNDFVQWHYETETLELECLHWDLGVSEYGK